MDLPNDTKLSEFIEEMRKGESLLTEGLWEGPKAFLAALAHIHSKKNLLIVTASAREDRLQADINFFTQAQVLDFPAWETLPQEQIAPSPDIVGDRLKILQSISQDKHPKIIIASLQACLQRTISPETLSQLSTKLSVGDELIFNELIELLFRMGYERQDVVADKRQFATRGGIIDIFPISSPDPIRIEFWGNQIESIRTFDPIGQKSISKLQTIALTPALEMELLEGAPTPSSILDYLGSNTMILFDDLLALEDKSVALGSSPSTSKTFLSFNDFLDLARPYQKLLLSESNIEELAEIHYEERRKANIYSANAPAQHINFEVFGKLFHLKRWLHPFMELQEYFSSEDPATFSLATISKFAATDLKLTFLYDTDSDLTYLQSKLNEEEVKLPTGTSFQRGYLSSGFAINSCRWVLFPLAELTHRYKIRRQRQRGTYHTPPSELLELSSGDLIVHLQHGIGKFLGIDRKPNHLGIETEFLQLEYGDQSKLFVPLSQSYLISKYVGSSEELPKLHSLNSPKWKNLRAKTETAIVGYASDLLKLYAERHIAGGFSYPQDGVEMKLFETEFPYVETEDQLSAIQNIKDDMLAVKAMDRLVCGDVGYGKTEVAMRAAFKAVVDGKKQVAILVPTTVLAMQHYETFADRMRNFPVTVDVLSRFRSQKEIQSTLKAVESGAVDILIGTHRIISKDVHFRDLGLIIIDEEQRFGVKAKEHLKAVKQGVDCLTLSATPIPRTLYMSIIGARDVSVINTPPQDRLPIKTIVCEADDATIHQALLRELSRDGQVYFIHNRVESIFQVADKIKTLLPQSRVLVAHGQMSSDELDMVFHSFKQGNVDILVATTIVENGIDIPNANTIFVDRADTFGLADLYQLRGRVGRWNRRAYCYFLTPKRRALPEIAKKRLDALQLTSGYGGGMRIAMRDLEIRGAGDLLGTEQSGHISAIGFHLYCKMLKRTIETMQGKTPAALTDTRLEFPQDARLPEEYINATSLRMEIYQRLGEATSPEEVDELYKEIKDRFGQPPPPAVWLHHFTRIRVHASRLHYSLVKLQQTSLYVEKRHGDKVVSNTMLLQIPKKPEDLEKKVIELLNQASTKSVGKGTG